MQPIGVSAGDAKRPAEAGTLHPLPFGISGSDPTSGSCQDARASSGAPLLRRGLSRPGCRGPYLPGPPDPAITKPPTRQTELSSVLASVNRILCECSDSGLGVHSLGAFLDSVRRALVRQVSPVPFTLVISHPCPSQSPAPGAPAGPAGCVPVRLPPVSTTARSVAGNSREPGRAFNAHLGNTVALYGYAKDQLRACRRRRCRISGVW
jgi:hypothetical protein